MKNLPLIAMLVLAGCSQKNEPERDMEDVETVESTAPGLSEFEMTPPAEPQTVDSLESESMEAGAASQTEQTRPTETSDGSQTPSRKTATALKETTLPPVEKHASPPAKKKATSPSPTASVAAPDTAYLRLLSSPPYAQIWMDGKAVGETPMTEYLAVKSGSHELSLQHRNHPQKDTVISLARGDSLKLKIKLEEKVAGGTEE